MKHQIHQDPANFTPAKDPNQHSNPTTNICQVIKQKKIKEGSLAKCEICTRHDNGMMHLDCTQRNQLTNCRDCKNVCGRDAFYIGGKNICGYHHDALLFRLGEIPKEMFV